MARLVGPCCFAIALLAQPAAAQTTATDATSSSATAPIPDVADPRALDRLGVPGLILGVIGYVSNVLTAGSTILSHLEGWPAHTPSTDTYVGAYFGTSFVPIAGPFISAGLIHELPISLAAHLIAGVVELIGWGLGIAGLVLGHGSSRGGRTDGFFAQCSFVPVASTMGGGATLVIAL
jgi:hypothetical protein